MEHALAIQARLGVERAVEWIVSFGISREFALLALLGAARARNFGVGCGSYLGH